MTKHRHWKAQGEKKGIQGVPKGSEMESKMKLKSTQNDVLNLKGGPEKPKGDFGWIWGHFLSVFMMLC